MENKKNILLSIHNIDSLAYQLNNKFKFMNLQMLVQILDSLTDEQMELCAEKISTVEKIITSLKETLDQLEQPCLELIESYDRSKFE